MTRPRRQSSLRRRHWTIFGLCVVAVSSAYLLVWSNIVTIQWASHDYEQFFERPKAMAQQVQATLRKSVEDSRRLAGTPASKWREAAQHLLSTERATIWDRRSMKEGEWISVHTQLPIYQEAVRGSVVNGTCVVETVLRYEEGQLNSVTTQQPLFPMDAYCQYFQSRPHDPYVSRLLGWYVTRNEQIPNDGRDPTFAVNGRTTYDGILRFGASTTRNGTVTFTLLALDWYAPLRLERWG